MRYDKTRTNQVVLNKVTGNHYIIVSKSDLDGTFIAKLLKDGEFVRRLEDVEYDPSNEEVIITEANTICYRMVRDLTAPEVPNISDYQITDGKLCNLQNNPVCEHGEIKVLEIVAALFNALILRVLVGDTGYLYSYQIDKDRFYRFCKVDPSATIDVVRRNGGRNIWLAINRIEKEEIKLSDEETKFASIIKDSKLAIIEPRDYLSMDIAGVVSSDPKDYVEAQSGDIYVICRESATSLTDKDNNTYQVVGESDRATIYFFDTCDDSLTKLHAYYSKDVEILYSSYYNEPVFVSSEKVVYLNNSFVPTDEIVKKILDHPHLVDISTNERVTNWYFSTEGKELKVYGIEVTSTKDRGILVRPMDKTEPVNWAEELL